jgi:hypothetical protein
MTSQSAKHSSQSLVFDAIQISNSTFGLSSSDLLISAMRRINLFLHGKNFKIVQGDTICEKY